MNTETRVPSPDHEVAQESPPTNLPDQVRQMRAIPPMIDRETGNPVQKHGHTATAEFGEVVGAIAAVMLEIQPVEKGGRNTFHDYKYARMQDILQALTPLMGKHGVVVFQYEAARNMFDDGKVMAITYDFIVAHKSGQTWINPVPQTGMSPCRTSRGTFDDKAFAKCHTSARKYFLLSLFQIPTEDEDADEGPKARAAAAPVPGPTGYVPPHRIEPGKNEKFPAWADRYEKAIGHSKTAAELVQWDELNDDLLSQLNGGNAELYARIMAAVAKVQAGLAVAAKAQEPTDQASTGQPARADTASVPTEGGEGANDVFERPEGCPDPNKEPDSFLNWADARMQAITDPEALDVYFQNEIDPASDGIMKPDYEALQGMLARHQKRLGVD